MCGTFGFLCFWLCKGKLYPAICDQPHHYCGFRFQRFCSGILFGEVSKKNGLLFGAISGLLLFILFLLAGVIVFHGAPVLTTLTRLAVMVLAGAIGGLLSVSKKSKIK